MPRFNTPFPFAACLTSLFLLAACLLSNVDTALFLQLNAASQLFPNAFWGLLTSLADPIIAPLLIFTLFYQNVLFLRAFFIALALALLVNYSLKYGFDIKRPTTLLDTNSFTIIGPIINSPSFPSGHTITIFTLMGLLSAWYQKRAVSLAVFTLAACISFTRISVGAHWPSDVLFGALIGCLIGWLAVEINSRLEAKSSTNLPLTGYFIALFVGIFSLITKTPYATAQWLSTAVSLFTIAYALKSITALLHRQKG
ncbi:MAG: phosphatase PAP2 family protein [Leucothrix sp.]